MAYSPLPAARASANVRGSHERFLDFLYGTQTGYLEICFCNGDPTKQQVQRDRWYTYAPHTVSHIAARIRQLVHQYGNVYISGSLYRKPTRDRTHTLPSRIVFLDDAPVSPRLPYSAVI